jgi:hypothetical protein
MKKLTYLASAIAAGFSANAVADVSVSGSGNAAYVSDAAGEGNVTVGSSVDFGLSTTTANGISISTGLSITVTVDGDSAAVVGGGQSLTFAGDGATVVVGDISVADTPGSVAGVIGGALAENEASKGAGFDTDVAEAFDDDDGMGVSLSTSAAGASISVAYVFDTAATSNSFANVDSTSAASSFGVTVPMGDFSVSAGVASHDSGESAAGGSVSAKVGTGTLKIGYSQQTVTIDASADKTAGFTTTLATDVTTASDGDLVATKNDAETNHVVVATAVSPDTITIADLVDVSVSNVMFNTASGQDADMAGDTSVFSAAYSMALDADTSFATSYKNAQDAEGHSYTQFEVSISRSLGGGASVYIDMANISGDVDVAAHTGSAFGFGTSVSF